MSRRFRKNCLLLIAYRAIEHTLGCVKDRNETPQEDVAKVNQGLERYARYMKRN